jgi:hypothetical protein
MEAATELGQSLYSMHRAHDWSRWVVWNRDDNLLSQLSLIFVWASIVPTLLECFRYCGSDGFIGMPIDTSRKFSQEVDIDVAILTCQLTTLPMDYITWHSVQ